jgi:hypothetical protein
VIKVSEAVSGEIVLEKLLDTSAGLSSTQAPNGLLILRKVTNG